MDELRRRLKKLGKIDVQEIKSIVLFVLILGFWATSRLHGISATSVAFVGAVIALLPRVGIVKWNDVDVPWHLMRKRVAYTLGSGFDYTDLPSITVNAIFDHMGIGPKRPSGSFIYCLQESWSSARCCSSRKQ